VLTADINQPAISAKPSKMTRTGLSAGATPAWQSARSAHKHVVHRKNWLCSEESDYVTKGISVAVSIKMAAFTASDIRYYIGCERA
jgi:hypothetical protein